MTLAPETAAFQEQYVTLLQRISFSDTKTETLAADSIHDTSTNGVLIPVPSGQAVRLVSLDMSATLTPLVGTWKPSTGIPTIGALGILVGLQGGFNHFARLYGKDGYANAGSAAPNGVNFHVSEDDLILFSDYLEVGGIPPGLLIAAEATFTGPTAAVTGTINVSIDVLVEYYLLRQGMSGLVGFAGFKAK